MRTYQKTHRWITFNADLSKAPYHFWMLLGECQSKCEHLNNVALKPETAKELFQVFLAKGIAATTAIEGNTLSEEQVRQQVEGKLNLPPSQQYLATEVDNILRGCNLILKEIKERKEPPLTRQRIEQLNEIVLKDLPLEDKETVPGKIRKHNVEVARYRGAPAEDCEFLLDELCTWLNSGDFPNPPGQEISFAIIKAVLAHLYMAWIHPFGDGNGRTARLLELQILIASGVPSPAAHLMSNHYNQTRSEYYRQLDLASKSGGDIIPFLVYSVQGLRDGLKAQLRKIFVQQLETIWTNYVYEKFKDKRGHSNTRMRKLVLELSKSDIPVPANKISLLSPELSAEYATKTSKTLSRDLNQVVSMKLVEKVPEGYKANIELLRSLFAPRRHFPKK